MREIKWSNTQEFVHCSTCHQDYIKGRYHYCITQTNFCFKCANH